MAYKNKLSAFKQSEDEEKEEKVESAGDILNKQRTEQEEKDAELDAYENIVGDDDDDSDGLGFGPIELGLSKGNYLYGSEAAITKAHNDGMTELMNTLSVIAEKEREMKDAKRATAQEEGFGSLKDQKKFGKAEKKLEKGKIKQAEKKISKISSSEEKKAELDQRAEMMRKGYSDSQGNLTEKGKREKERRRERFEISRELRDVELEEMEQEPEESATPMKSPLKAGVHRFNVDALRRGAMGAGDRSANTRANTQGMSNVYDIFSVQRDLQRKRTEKELANYNIDEVQSGFESFNNGGSTCGEYVKTKKEKLAKLKAKARRVNPNSKKFQDYKSQMKEIDNSMKKLNGVMEGLQLHKADFADKHGKGDQDNDGRFRYSEATRQSDSYFYLQQAMNKTAPMIIQEDGSVVFKVMNKGGEGFSAMTMDQMQEGIYEKDDSGYQFYAAVQDSVAANHKANNYFDETTANANLGKIFGFGEDVNKNNLMSWVHDFPEIGKDGKTFINNYMDQKLGDARIKVAGGMIDELLTKGHISQEDYDAIMFTEDKDGKQIEDGIDLEEAMMITGKVKGTDFAISDEALTNEYIPEAQYFDPDNTHDWGQESTFDMTLSGDSEGRTIGMHVRDELKAYYMQMLKDKHNKLVDAEIRGNGKGTHTKDWSQPK
tara:strand:+ start:199 stop:2178 length:1980 start_codon:yes stop_codon:yes gene_type:complete